MSIIRFLIWVLLFSFGSNLASACRFLEQMSFVDKNQITPNIYNVCTVIEEFNSMDAPAIVETDNAVLRTWMQLRPYVVYVFDHGVYHKPLSLSLVAELRQLLQNNHLVVLSFSRLPKISRNEVKESARILRYRTRELMSYSRYNDAQLVYIVLSPHNP